MHPPHPQLPPPMPQLNNDMSYTIQHTPTSNTGSLLNLANNMVSVEPCLFPTGSTTVEYGSSISQELPDSKEFKDYLDECCPVCGDKVSGYHYGLLTCESCKGFFKRTVQNKKMYNCVAERQCQIDKTQRKRCPYCRFQKCMDVGMKLEAVRADRMRGGRNKFGPMYKRDRARKLQIIRQRQITGQHLRPGLLGPPANEAVTISYSGNTPTSNQIYSNGSTIHIKQEIQSSQVSSLTSSPDSSPSPIAHQLSVGGQVSSSPALHQDHRLTWVGATSPSSISPKSFSFEQGGGSGGGGSGAGSGGGAVGGGPKMPPLVRDFLQCVDDKEWQNTMFALLQKETFNQCEVDLFELMCKVLDQNLFSQVDWARNSIFFRDLVVEDQMKLLQNSWSDMLILDHMHQRLHANLPDETTLPNGQKFDVLSLALLGVHSMIDQFNDLSARLQEIKFDVCDYVCLKFLLLLNPDVRTLINRKHVVDSQEQVKQVLMDYTMNTCLDVQDKFTKLLSIIPELHAMSNRGEDFLYYKHIDGAAHTQSLLMEMLHGKKK